MSKCDKCKYQDKNYSSNGTYYCSQRLIYPSRALTYNCDMYLGAKITQADKIRSMSDEELAEFLFKFSLSVYYGEIKRDNKNYLRFGKPLIEIEHNQSEFKKWLQSEVTK